MEIKRKYVGHNQIIIDDQTFAELKKFCKENRYFMKDVSAMAIKEFLSNHQCQQ